MGGGVTLRVIRLDCIGKFCGVPAADLFRSGDNGDLRLATLAGQPRAESPAFGGITVALTELDNAQQTAVAIVHRTILPFMLESLNKIVAHRTSRRLQGNPYRSGSIPISQFTWKTTAIFVGRLGLTFRSSCVRTMMSRVVVETGGRGGRPLQAAAKAYIRFMFHAMVTRLHSPWTLSRPRRRNWRSPSLI
jgi:hypothetical protein